MDIVLLVIALALMPALIKLVKDSMDGILDLLLMVAGAIAFVALCCVIYRDALPL